MPRFANLADLAAIRPFTVRLAFFSFGALTMLSFAPVGWYPLALLFVAPLLAAYPILSPRQAAQVGFAYGAGLFLAGTYWLYVSIHVFGNAPLVLAILLMLGLVVIMATYYAAAGWLIARLCADSLSAYVLLAPAIWVVLEWLRGWFLSGFPWMTLGYSQVDSPLSGFAPVTGIYGVSYLLVLTVVALIGVTRAAGRSRLLLGVIAILPWPTGYVLNGVTWTTVAGPAVRTSIVQGGVPQDRKWLPEQFMPTLDLYRESLVTERASDLVVWPEVAIPTVLDRVEAYVSLLEQETEASETTLLFGILESDGPRERIYNSIVAVGGGDRQVYRKRHLVPFGEYFPVPDFVREWMRLMNLPYSDISAGKDVQPLLQMRDGNRLSVAICYEDAYAAEQLYALPEATILVNVSNDAWFGDTIAPHQHLQIARMRALEAGRYVVRATNNGVSAFIGPKGELLATGPQFEYVTMRHEVLPLAGLTPYAKAGNWPVILILTVPILIVAWRKFLPGNA